MPLVPTAHVITPRSPSHYFIRKMMGVLLKQGQIEPLQVQKYCDNPDGTEVYTTFTDDTHGADILRAAQNLGWSHISIAIVDKYEY